MKKLIFTSLIAMFGLCLCQNNAKAQEKSDDKIYDFTALSSPPTYPGGLSELYKFLGQNIRYPLTAIKDSIQGSVLMSFVVEKNGTLNDIKVDRKLGGGTDEEAVRVLKLVKPWNAGSMDGKAVRVKYNIPIKFNLPNLKIKSNGPEIVKPSEPGEDNGVYSFISMESPPMYPGGMTAFYKFIGSNLKYPDAAKKEKVQGSVLISFMVEKDGLLNDIKIDRKLGYGTDEEALRVLKLAKRWNPGMVNGKPVRVKYNIPIKFALNTTTNKN